MGKVEHPSRSPRLVVRGVVAPPSLAALASPWRTSASTRKCVASPVSSPSDPATTAAVGTSRPGRCHAAKFQLDCARQHVCVKGKGIFITQSFDDLEEHDSQGKGCLSDCPAGHTARYIKRAGLAPTSAPPNGSRRPVVVYTGHQPRTSTN